VGADPPLNGVTVKITALPEQILFVFAVIMADGVTTGFTCTVMLFETTLLVDAHELLTVRLQEITSPFINEAIVKTGLLPGFQLVADKH